MPKKCECYHERYGKSLCWGTKEMEECSCGGDESKCNFYPEKRKRVRSNPTISGNPPISDCIDCKDIAFGCCGSCNVYKSYWENYEIKQLEKVFFNDLKDYMSLPNDKVGRFVNKIRRKSGV